MKKPSDNLLWGVLLIVIGIGFAGNVFNLWNFEVFFDGWWTLLIIIPALISMIQHGIRLWNSIALGVGILFLISSLGYINVEIIGDLIFPLIIISIGASLILKGRFNKKTKKTQEISQDSTPEYTAIFGAQEINFPEKEFKGADITAVFGGIELDLRQAIIKEDIYITSTAIFGGIDIMVPSNVWVEISSTPIFGGATNKVIRPIGEDIYTIYINSTTIFGGTEVK